MAPMKEVDISGSHHANGQGSGRYLKDFLR